MENKSMLICYMMVAALSINSILSIYLLPTPDSEQIPGATPTCCQCQNHNSNKKSTRLHISKSVSKLSPTYRNQSLTRLGTDLKFDLSMCPKKSLMRTTNLKEFVPKHLDCPTLFIIGARKGGTSSLYQYVSKHPDFEGIRLANGPASGETMYFSSDYKKISWEKYLNYFPSDGVMSGDASVGNLVSCEAPVRIFKYCGKQAKIVVLLRNPINRFVSNFLMRARLKTARMTETTAISTLLKLQLDRFFSKVLQDGVDITKLPEQWSKITCAFKPAVNLVFEGMYYAHLMNWLCNFPAENMLIVNSEEFFNKPGMILDQVLQFLGLKTLDEETYDWITSNVYNKRQENIQSYQQLTTLERKKLGGTYEAMNKALLNMLDWQDLEWN